VKGLTIYVSQVRGDILFAFKRLWSKSMKDKSSNKVIKLRCVTIQDLLPFLPHVAVQFTSCMVLQEESKK